MHLLGYSAVSDVGHQRTNNEDCYLCSPKHGLWLVADGMGGHAAGEVASAIACDTTLSEIKSGHSLEKALQSAHLSIIDASNRGIGGEGMGSTIVSMRSFGDRYQVAWVGDSRAYLFNRKQKSLTQLTRDHSYVQMLFDTGAIQKHEMDAHPEKNIITQCLGSIELEHVAVSSVAKKWQRGDLIVLCSDGLTDTVSNELICDIVTQHKSPKQVSSALLSQALASGGKDNITIVVVSAPAWLQQWLYAIPKKIIMLFKQGLSKIASR